MRLALSIDALKPPLTGIGHYVRQLAARLPKQGVEIQPLIRGRRVTQEELDNRLLYARGGVARADAWAALGRLVENQAALSRAAQIAIDALSGLFPLVVPGADIAHGPNYYLPATRGMRRVVTFHDLSALHRERWHMPGRSARIACAMRQMAQSADCIIADSEAVRGEIIDVFDLPENRVVAVPLGVGEEYHPRELAELALLLAPLGLRAKGYVLSVGTLEPRKNLARAIEAYARLPSRLREETPLVLVGRRGWNDADIVASVVRGQEAGWLRYLGYVDEQDLPAVYSGAACFLYPSYYEGFGLPVLEAMASGVPVVTSNQGALAEVAGGVAELVDANETEEIVAALVRMLDDRDRLRVAAQRGLDRAARFSWELCAARTAEVYRAVAG